jgi:uncharacterized damage-inducible protein DinB
MAFDVTDIIEGTRQSRAHFRKHLEGLTEEQWTWQPYPECKSVRDTLSHMIANDRIALQSMRDGTVPNDWYAFFQGVDDEFALVTNEELLDAHHAGHEAILTYLTETYSADTPLDKEMDLWGGKGKLGAQINHLSSEDFYHAGQVSFIRMATRADWNYYGEVLGVG